MLPHHVYCFTGKTIFQKTNLSEVWRTPSNGSNFLRVTKEYPWRKAGLRNLKNSIEKQVYNQKPRSLMSITTPQSPPVKHESTLHLPYMRWINRMLSACHHEVTTDGAQRISSCFVSRGEAVHWGALTCLETLVQFLLDTGFLPPELSAQNMTQAFCSIKYLHRF